MEAADAEIEPARVFEGHAARLRAAYKEGPVPPIREQLVGATVDRRVRHPGDQHRALACRGPQARRREDRPHLESRADPTRCRSAGFRNAARRHARGGWWFDSDWPPAAAESGGGGRLHARARHPPARRSRRSRTRSRTRRPPSRSSTAASRNGTSASSIRLRTTRRLASSCSGSQRAPLEAIDLRLCGMVLEKNGVPTSFGVGAACLGNPLLALAWLARKMEELGEPLKAGDVVLAGALGPMIAAQPGDAFTASIAGLGSVSVRFGS